MAANIRPAEFQVATRPDMPMNSAERDAFVAAMRGTVSGVNVLTTDGPAGRFGLTVSAFSSVSADPPMVMVCVNARSPAAAAVRDNRQFRVNVLGATQRQVAETFAGHPASGAPYDFSAARWDSRDGTPALEGAVASFGCLLVTTVAAGTHLVFIGRVTQARQSIGPALLYTDRAYGRPSTGAELN